MITLTCPPPLRPDSAGNRLRKTVKLTNRVNTRIRLNRDVRAAVSDVSAVNRERVLAAARAVHRNVDRVRLAVGVRGADVNLVGEIVANTGRERDELYPVAIIKRKLACLVGR